jgi:acyl-CoA synthetase (AMP-forming)/AMP-acid ligase II
MGEVPVAFVVAPEGGDADALVPALQAEIETALARFKRPVAYHLLDSLPRNPIGKIDKPALRQRLERAAQPATAP